MPAALASASVVIGSNPMTFMPKAFIRMPTSRPIRPKPKTAKVLPYNSHPEYNLRSHLPSTILFAAGTTGRANVPINKHVNSHADIELPPGVLRKSRLAHTKNDNVQFKETAHSNQFLIKYSLQHDDIMFCCCIDVNVINTGSSTATEMKKKNKYSFVSKIHSKILVFKKTHAYRLPSNSFYMTRSSFKHFSRNFRIRPHDQRIIILSVT